MKKSIYALALLLAYGEAHALTWVNTPKGNYAVEETPNGFNVYGMSGQGVTSVTRNGGGYTVMSPEGVTNIYTDGSTSKPGLSVDPFDLGATPVIPNLGD